MTDFPYKRLLYSDQDIMKMFNNLRNYDIKKRLRELPYTIRNLNIPSSQLTFLGKSIILISKETDYLDFNLLSDMFQEKCRMQCKVGRLESPHDFFLKNRERILAHARKKYGDLNAHHIRESLYDLTKECSSHRPSNIVAMIQMFRAKSVLDFSAGWGDRLVGAMAADIDRYVGIDPNHCLHEGYQEMIRFFGKDPSKYIMIESGAEDAVIPDWVGGYDMIYTSPPYFDLEIYSANSKQSVSKYNKEDKWFNEFLMKVIKKMWGYLREGGVMVININQKNKKEHYVTDMLKEVEKMKDANYLGVISYADETLINPQPIWIWKKGPQK